MLASVSSPLEQLSEKEIEEISREEKKISKKAAETEELLAEIEEEKAAS